MKHDIFNSSIHGSLAGFATTFVGLEAFGVKLMTGLVIAVLSTVASYFVKRYLDKRLGKVHDD